ncbi:hypothetical protein [Cyanobium sp. Morenito 9A2]|uniref:hypothetical protein n=1 Tax=Cyanobium sp. Morenito 9A2 TaxID=2823718 RepID=UPI0020CBC3BE|nr:hypothetical protein [Cyanobium sp. Morenito 9A2]MCP9848504.1 hypothetical protein [Cyanobium sp. Morenito 9A2]
MPDVVLGGLWSRSRRRGTGMNCPWLVVVAGVALGPAVGFSPWLFLAVGVGCLLSGFSERA